MLEKILRFSIEHRWLVVLGVVLLAVVGVHSLLVLPIDAVPDITNNQVQINTFVLPLSPEEIKKGTPMKLHVATLAICILGCTYAASSTYAAEEKAAAKPAEAQKGEAVAVDKLPKAVTDAVKKAHPGAKITKAFKQSDGNYLLDDVKVGKKEYDITVSPEGKIISSVEQKDKD